jgi:hypothetical protein
MKMPVCCWLVDEAGDTGLGEGRQRQRPPSTAWSGKKNTSDSASSTMKRGKLIVSLIKCAPGFDRGSLKIQVAPEVGSGQAGAKPLPPPLTGPNISGYP